MPAVNCVILHILNTVHLYKFWASEIAQGVKALATKPGDLSLIPETHKVGGNQLLQVFLWLSHI